MLSTRATNDITNVSTQNALDVARVLNGGAKTKTSYRCAGGKADQSSAAVLPCPFPINVSDKFVFTSTRTGLFRLPQVSPPSIPPSYLPLFLSSSLTHSRIPYSLALSPPLTSQVARPNGGAAIQFGQVLMSKLKAEGMSSNYDSWCEEHKQVSD
jgi:hypothetical protein